MKKQQQNKEAHKKKNNRDRRARKAARHQSNIGFLHPSTAFQERRGKETSPHCFLQKMICSKLDKAWNKTLAFLNQKNNYSINTGLCGPRVFMQNYSHRRRDNMNRGRRPRFICPYACDYNFAYKPEVY